MSIFNEELLHDLPTLCNASDDEDDEQSDDDEDFAETFHVKSKYPLYILIIFPRPVKTNSTNSRGVIESYQPSAFFNNCSYISYNSN